MLNKYSKLYGLYSKFIRKNTLQTIYFSYSVIDKELGFTTAFQEALKQKLSKKQSNSFLRLQIFAGEGCEGFTYKFKFDKQLKDEDYPNQQKRVVFATNGEQMKLLKGATIDYAEQMMRQIFYVKQNPNAQISCSCKTSFSPKEYVF